ncbi:MAG: glucosaminidase domain-containing protein [Actinomycetia bacterium]|nr:glucosaminidase domain-containing protein [Actinomycetes bacterium]
MVTLSTAACGAPPASKPVMGQSAVSAADMATWFHTKGSGGSASVPVEQLAAMFIEEGNAEGVAGDLAFVQAMVETGWLRFSARMPMHHNNFSGIGAVDGGGSSAAFPHARAGVRAQIQHLRAYADPSVTGQTLSNPLVDPRFDLVNKGSAASWGNFGNGIWATDPGYSSKIHRLHDELVAFAAAP